MALRQLFAGEMIEFESELTFNLWNFEGTHVAIHLLQV